MKKAMLQRLLAGMLAIVMTIMAIPVVAIAKNDSEAYTEEDYTPFLLETMNGRAVYNAQTADMTYDFYLEAREYIDKNGSDHLKRDGNLTFTTGGCVYNMTNVYYMKPKGDYWLDWESTCGLLTGILNFRVNGEAYHVVLVAFRGTDGFYDAMTDADFIQKANGYHSGFHNAARNHYERMEESVYYRLEDGQSISFTEYLDRMCYDPTYKMIVTGHSLGAAVANIFTSKYVNGYQGMDPKNAVAYTYASPLTCSEQTANTSVGSNIFNLLNRDDIVTVVGAFMGTRAGTDLPYRLNRYTRTCTNLKNILTIMGTRNFLRRLFDDWKNDIGDNHHMRTAYSPVKAYVNSHIDDYTDSFVLYTGYDAVTKTHQRILYNNGTLIVRGTGVLDGDWRQHTLVDWARIERKCTRLVFDENCNITEIGDHAFAGMAQLTGTLYLPKGIEKIGGYAFFHCGINGELNITANVKEVGVNAFNGCSGLSLINATQAKDMAWGYGAFANCVGSHDLLLPANNEEGEDLSDVFSTYYVEDSTGGYIITCDDQTAGNVVLPKDKVYIGRIKDESIAIRPFLDFHYMLTLGHTDTSDNIKELASPFIHDVASIDETGCLSIASNCPEGTEFTVVVLFDLKGEPDYNVYDSGYFIHFTVGKRNAEFAGGLGTEQRPYLIETADQFLKIRDHSDKHFKLISDIDFQGKAVSPVSSLTGSLDGNGYSVYHFNISGVAIAALFDRIEENASVKRLTVGKAGKETIITATGESHSAASAIASSNYGTIENCTVVNVTLSANSNTDESRDKTIYSHAGGLVIYNVSGTIRSCHVESCHISAHAKAEKDSNPAKAHASSAGVAVHCRVDSTLSDVSSIGNTVSSYAYSVDTWIIGAKNYEGRGFAYSGGIVAKSESNNSLQSCASYGNALSANKESDDGETKTNEFVADGNTATQNCTATVRNYDTRISSYNITSLPKKTHYFIGEVFNPYGLEIRDSKKHTVNGYSISGYNAEKPGTQTLTVSYTTGDGTFTDTFAVTVDNIVPQAVIIQPKKTSYNVTNTLTEDDFTATIHYNNGTTEVKDSLAAQKDDKVTFTAVTKQLDEADLQILQLSYNYAYRTASGTIVPAGPFPVNTAVDVNCAHTHTATTNATPATTSEYGYTGDLVCLTCHLIVEEGAVINVLTCNEHKFGAWVKVSDEEHSRTCTDCNVTESASHRWNAGEVTVEPTQTTEGKKKYTCSDCGAVTYETLPPITTGEVPLILLDNVKALPGGQVEMRICLKNNPGIASMKLKVTYDESILTLQGVRYGIEMGGMSQEPQKLTSPVTLNWYNGASNCEGDHVYATLIFSVDQAAVHGKTSVMVTYDPEDVYEIGYNNISFDVQDGEISILDHVPGDISGDGVVNNKDLSLLFRYLSDWDVAVNEAALDVNGDGRVNNKDLSLLFQYLSDWDVTLD